MVFSYSKMYFVYPENFIQEDVMLIKWKKLMLSSLSNINASSHTKNFRSNLSPLFFKTWSLTLWYLFPMNYLKFNQTPLEGQIEFYDLIFTNCIIHILLLYPLLVQICFNIQVFDNRVITITSLPLANAHSPRVV